jgi:signal peptidase II
MTTARTPGARPRRYLLLVLVALAAIGVDLLTKEWVLATFQEGERLDVVGEIVQYEDVYRLCFMRAPEGFIIGLAEQLS